MIKKALPLLIPQMHLVVVFKTVILNVYTTELFFLMCV